MSKCSASLIELQNAMKREIADEIAGSKMYQDMAVKLTALGETNYSEIFHLLSDAEHMHSIVLESLVEALDFRCEEALEDPSSPLRQEISETLRRKGKRVVGGVGSEFSGGEPIELTQSD